jgi:hypothetical protein
MPPKTTQRTTKTSTKTNAKGLNKEKHVRESQVKVPLMATVKRKLTYVGLMLIPTMVIVVLLDQPLHIGDQLFEENPFLPQQNPPSGLYDSDAELAPFFTASVQYWEPAIYGWAQEAELNPNIVATIIQIESCGHPYVSSNVGAQGLVQVMPLNFQDGDNQLDLNTNVRTGMKVFNDCLRWTTNPSFGGNPNASPDVGVALACYNGGPGVISMSRSDWYEESQNYYKWGTGIWQEASQGLTYSNTLNEWINAGGIHLCNRALQAQEQFDPIQALLPR